MENNNNVSMKEVNNGIDERFTEYSKDIGTAEKANEIGETINEIRDYQRGVGFHLKTIIYNYSIDQCIDHLQTFGKMTLDCQDFKYYTVDEKGTASMVVKDSALGHSTVALDLNDPLVAKAIEAKGAVIDEQSNIAIKPIYSNDKLLGVIVAENSNKTFTFDDLNRFSLDHTGYPFAEDLVKISDKIRDSFKIEELENIKNHDALTGAYSLTAFNAKINSIVGEITGGANKRDDEKPYYGLIIDVDKFKSINDTFGHNAGDLALKSVTEVAQDVFKRKDDMFARTGGDEFQAVIQVKDETKAMELAEEFRSRVAALDFSDKDEAYSDMRITASVGVGRLEPDDYLKAVAEGSRINGAQVYEHSTKKNIDSLLYKAKEYGRNLCVSKDRLEALKDEKTLQELSEASYQNTSYITRPDIQTITTPFLLTDEYDNFALAVEGELRNNKGETTYRVHTEVEAIGNATVKYNGEYYENINECPEELLTFMRCGREDLYEINTDTLGYKAQTTIINDSGETLATVISDVEINDFSKMTLADIRTKIEGNITQPTLEELVKQQTLNKSKISEYEIAVDETRYETDNGYKAEIDRLKEIKELAMSDDCSKRRLVLDYADVPQEIVDVLKNDIDAMIVQKYNSTYGSPAGGEQPHGEREKTPEPSEKSQKKVKFDRTDD